MNVFDCGVDLVMFIGRSKSRKILIVDDEEDLSWSISRSFKRSNALLEIKCVQNGEEAFRMLEKNAFDLVISDYRMPGKNGLELLEQIGKRYARTKVILMTAYGSSEIETRVRRMKNAAYIEKPFDIYELKRMITKMKGNENLFTGSAGKN